MKLFHLIPLVFLTACSTTPRLALRPQQPPPAMDDSAIRYSEVLRAYHVGRYTDPNDDLLMHERHVVYRVEQNTRWNFHPGPVDGSVSVLPSHDAAFAPQPVNDAILAEVNSQKAATTQIVAQAQTLSAALAQFQSALQQTKTNLQETAVLRATLNDMKQRLNALETAQRQLTPPATIPATNEPPHSLSP